ncbi:unnamed protein product [Rhizophagus irregularis]|nr:unnamed protein product [Rhizophagus irregularis]
MVPVNKPLITIADAVHAFNEDGSLVDKHFENKIIKVLQNLVKLGKQLKIDIIAKVPKIISLKESINFVVNWNKK